MARHVLRILVPQPVVFLVNFLPAGEFPGAEARAQNLHLRRRHELAAQVDPPRRAVAGAEPLVQFGGAVHVARAHRLQQRPHRVEFQRVAIGAPRGRRLEQPRRPPRPLQPRQPQLQPLDRFGFLRQQFAPDQRQVLRGRFVRRDLPLLQHGAAHRLLDQRRPAQHLVGRVGRQHVGHDVLAAGHALVAAPAIALLAHQHVGVLQQRERRRHPQLPVVAARNQAEGKRDVQLRRVVPLDDHHERGEPRRIAEARAQARKEAAPGEELPVRAARVVVGADRRPRRDVGLAEQRRRDQERIVVVLLVMRVGQDAGQLGAGDMRVVGDEAVAQPRPLVQAHGGTEDEALGADAPGDRAARADDAVAQRHVVADRHRLVGRAADRQVLQPAGAVDRRVGPDRGVDHAAGVDDRRPVAHRAVVTRPAVEARVGQLLEALEELRVVAVARPEPCVGRQDAVERQDPPPAVLVAQVDPRARLLRLLPFQDAMAEPRVGADGHPPHVVQQHVVAEQVIRQIARVVNHRVLADVARHDRAVIQPHRQFEPRDLVHQVAQVADPHQAAEPAADHLARIEPVADLHARPVVRAAAVLLQRIDFARFERAIGVQPRLQRVAQRAFLFAGGQIHRPGQPVAQVARRMLDDLPHDRFPPHVPTALAPSGVANSRPKRKPRRAGKGGMGDLYLTRGNGERPRPRWISASGGKGVERGGSKGIRISGADASRKGRRGGKRGERRMRGIGREWGWGRTRWARWT
ncbi:MAG: hypothetical protein BWZ08_02667 [candidate division BRC1 bacterium ADurb.BinA292]|nr:MAG: hypothetical protein BWZ08_02667 [candidate division BRC1 bacterium ADurb.BinA292]